MTINRNHVGKSFLRFCAIFLLEFFVVFLVVFDGRARANDLQSKAAAIYSEHAKAILDRVEFDRKDLDKNINNCTSAVVLGGYGPTCEAAARDASELIKNLRVWTIEAENLKPDYKDSEFHSKFLENMNCQRDLTILDRDIARATQIGDLSKSLELQRQKTEKGIICFKMNLKINLGLIAIRYR